MTILVARSMRESTEMVTIAMTSDQADCLIRLTGWTTRQAVSNALEWALGSPNVTEDAVFHVLVELTEAARLAGLPRPAASRGTSDWQVTSSQSDFDRIFSQPDLI